MGSVRGLADMWRLQLGGIIGKVVTFPGHLLRGLLRDLAEKRWGVARKVELGGNEVTFQQLDGDGAAAFWLAAFVVMSALSVVVAVLVVPIIVGLATVGLLDKSGIDTMWWVTFWLAASAGAAAFPSTEEMDWYGGCPSPAIGWMSAAFLPFGALCRLMKYGRFLWLDVAYGAVIAYYGQRIFMDLLGI